MITKDSCSTCNKARPKVLAGQLLARNSQDEPCHGGHFDTSHHIRMHRAWKLVSQNSDTLMMEPSYLLGVSGHAVQNALHLDHLNSDRKG